MEWRRQERERTMAVLVAHLSPKRGPAFLAVLWVDFLRELQTNKYMKTDDG
jgi:hypothetical protein